MPFSQVSPQPRGLTLLELLTTIAIVATVSALSAAAFSSVREKARQATCMGNLRQLGVAIVSYTQDHHSSFPSTTHQLDASNFDEGWIHSLSPYLSGSDQIRICPADPKGDERLANNGTSYLLNSYLTVPKTDLLQLTQLSFVAGISPTLAILIAATALASWLVSSTLKRRFTEYSQIPIRYTGAQIAETMLRENGITDVRVISVPGQLTDHYDPVKKTVNLSESVYGMNSIAAAAVAAHECGHAVQHQKSYAWLALRSKMVPAVQFAGTTLNIMMMVGIFAAALFHAPAFLYVWIALFAVTTLFSVITLPVEFDASKRALIWLNNSGASSSMEQEKAKNALFWAAMTYVVAALGSLAMLIYYASSLLGRRN